MDSSLSCSIHFHCHSSTEALYAAVNQFHMVTGFVWTHSESAAERAPLIRNLYERWLPFGQMHSNDRSTQPQFVTDRCCQDSTFVTDSGFLRKVVIDRFRLIRRFTKHLPKTNPLYFPFRSALSNRFGDNNQGEQMFAEVSQVVNEFINTELDKKKTYEDCPFDRVLYDVLQQQCCHIMSCCICRAL